MIFAFDTETHLFQPGLDAPPLVCGSIADARGASILDKDLTRRFFRDALHDGESLVGCNVAFDLCVMAADDPAVLDLIFRALDEGRVHDVAIREALIDIARGELVEHEGGGGPRYSLALLAARYLGLDLSADKSSPDAWRLRYATLEHLPISEWPEAARAYPIADARHTFDIFTRQEGGPNLHDEPAQVRAAFALRLMSVWGLRTDRAAVAKLREKADADFATMKAELSKVGIYRPDGTKDTKSIQARVIEAFKGAPPTTPGGKVSTDRDTLTESGDPVLALLAGGGRNQKDRSTYLPILERGVDVPLNPTFNVLVATGRVSGDLQQLPQKGGIRETFTARPGFVFCSVDYGGLELRTMSQRAIDAGLHSLMAESLNRGVDVHTYAAAIFLGTTYEELLPRVEAKEEQAQAFRALAKIFNFGKGGGMGAAAMAYNARAKDGVRFCLLTKVAETCGVETQEARVQGKKKRVCSACIAVSADLGAGWLKAWPEQAELFREASRITRSDGGADVTIRGSGLVRGRCGYTQWLNTPFQGLGAALVKDAMYRVSREMHTDRRSPLWGSHLNLNVHDELIAELVESRAPEAGDRMALIMRETAAEWLPDLGPSITAEPALSRTLSKSAATVRDAAGRLQVWTPKKAA